MFWMLFPTKTRFSFFGRIAVLPVVLLVTVAVAAAACSGNDTDSLVAGRSPEPTLSISSAGLAGQTAAAGVGAGAESPDGASPKNIALKPVGEFEFPISMAASGDDIYLAEREGRIYGFSTDDLSEKELLLDISGKTNTFSEEGLLGITLSPDAKWLYFVYTGKDGSNIYEVVEVNSDGGLDTSRPCEILRITQPYSNHNGGDMAFGKDGFLYLAVGDGGSANDPFGNGQNTFTLLGTILRIDPDPESCTYDIPADNPFAPLPEGADPALAGGTDSAPGGGPGNNTEGAPEIFLYGLRNPWRMSFDSLGALYIGDVGQDSAEEINYIIPSENIGANLGWRTYEGFSKVDDGAPSFVQTPPIWVYGHAEGRCSITGGYFYEGSEVPQLADTYVYSDYCDGKIRILDLSEVRDGQTGRLSGNPEGDIVIASLPEGDSNPVSFGRDASGEIYVMTPKTLYRIVSG